MSLDFASETLGCFLFESEVLFLSLLEQRMEVPLGGRSRRRQGSAGGAPRDHRGSAGRLRWPGQGSWWPGHVHTSATAGVTGGRLLRRASTSAERARDAQHDAAEALRWLGWAEKARSSEHCGRCELGPSAMADAAAFSRCRARARQERTPGRSGELAIHSGGQEHASVWSRELGTRCSCMVDTHWTRVTRCDISSNSWRATE